jgi:hypothetical protein
MRHGKQQPGIQRQTLLMNSFIKSTQARGWGQGGEMNQALCAHMNNKRKMKINK